MIDIILHLICLLIIIYYFKRELMLKFLVREKSQLKASNINSLTTKSTTIKFFTNN